MGLFDPAWMTENEKKIGKAIAYVGKVADDAELATIAKQAHFQEIQQAAIERIADQTVLASIAMQGESYDFATNAAIERITNPPQLDWVARGADKITTRWLGIKRLVEACDQVDLAPYADDIAGGVRAADDDMLSLSDDLELMEKTYERYAHENYSWSGDSARKVRERANQVAREKIEAGAELRELLHIGATSMYSDDTKAAARKQASSLVAGLASAEAPFGTHSLVCPECGDAIVYHEAYAGHDSWEGETWGFFRCEKRCGGLLVTNDPFATFGVGDVPPNALTRHLVFLCPDCGKLRESTTLDPSTYTREPQHLDACACGSKLSAIPVRFSIDC